MWVSAAKDREATRQVALWAPPQHGAGQSETQSESQGGWGGAGQGLTLVHVRAQLEQLQDTFIS